jgi:hypothetical protein
MSGENLEVLEKVMDLMSRYEVDEVSAVGFHIKKSRHKPATILAPLDEKVAIDRHMATLPNEPWNAIPQEEVDTWAEKGKP